jgi:hypothetical protein
MLLCVAWLSSCYSFPESWRDFDGYNQLGSDIGISLLLLLCGVAMLTLAFVFARNPWFAVLVLLAPIAHYIGAGIEAPGCHPYFLAPSALILAGGLVKLVWKCRCGRESPPDKGKPVAELFG